MEKEKNYKNKKPLQTKASGWALYKEENNGVELELCDTDGLESVSLRSTDTLLQSSFQFV